MKNYMTQIRELGNNGKIRIGSYQSRQLDDQKFHQELISGIKNKAIRNAIGLEAVLGEAGKLLLYSYSRFAAIPVQYLQKHFGLKTMDYSYRAMHAAVAASGDRLTTREFTTIEHQVISAVKVSDYKKVRQGTYYTLVDGRIVRKYQSESGSVEYELVDTIPADRHKPKEPEKSWVEKATEGIVKAGLHVGLAGYKTGKAGLKLSKEALDFVVLDDVNTVLDSEASVGERIWAGASILPVGKPLKLIKAGGVIKFANKGKHTAKKVKKRNTVGKNFTIKDIGNFDLTPKKTPYNSLSRKQQLIIKEKIEKRSVTKSEYKRYQWNKRFMKRRATGVNNFWKQEKKRILKNDTPTRNWTSKQIEDILNRKKPQYNGKPIIGHHTFNAKNYPHISNKGELIYPATPSEHLKGWHGGSYHKNSPGKPVNPNYMEEF
ncbi:hypothetical protein D1839_20085 [Roseburia sp. 1XD42-34]|nr:hypothetical protein [Roseburia sp. 1XD42-34]RKI73734.1 hypothetical protein D7V87_20050 [Clostridium sp. 1xD42-85]